MLLSALRRPQRSELDEPECRFGDRAAKELLQMAMRQLNFSARSYHRVLKVARTIADLAGSEGIETTHLAEALQYRPRAVG